MEATGYPVVGNCDRCGSEISRRIGETYFLLKGTNIRTNLETYRLHFLLCSKCRRDFDLWIRSGRSER